MPAKGDGKIYHSCGEIVQVFQFGTLYIRIYCLNVNPTPKKERKEEKENPHRVVVPIIASYHISLNSMPISQDVNYLTRPSHHG